MTSRIRSALSFVLTVSEFFSLLRPSIRDSHTEFVICIRTGTAASCDSYTDSARTDGPKPDNFVQSATGSLTTSCMTLSASCIPRPLRLLRPRPRPIRTVTLRSTFGQSGLPHFSRRLFMILSKRIPEQDSQLSTNDDHEHFNFATTSTLPEVLINI